MNTTVDVREGLPSASNLWRTAMCPGWLNLSRDLTRKDTPDSLAGSLGHAALAGEDVGLDSKMEMTVEACREITARIVKEFGFEGCEVIKEKRFWAYDAKEAQWIGDMGLRRNPLNREGKMCSGQVDEMYLRQDAFLIIDYKTLFGEHESAASNWQLRTLDLVVGSQIESLLMNSVCAIVQPWKKGQFSTVGYSQETRADSRREIFAAVKAALTPNAPRTPGAWCGHCPGRAVCPEANDRSVEVVSHNQTMESMTPQERGDMLTWIDWAEDILSAKKTDLRAMLEQDPTSVAGWKLKTGKNRRSITNLNAAYDALKSMMTLQEFIALCQLSPAKLEEFMYQQDKKTNTRKQVEAVVAFALGDLIETKQDRESLVKI